MKKTLLALSLFAVVGCMRNMPQSMGDSSVKDVNIVLPEMSAFSDDATLQAKLSGYELMIDSPLEKCKKMPVTSKLTSLTIAEKIEKECDYTITLKVGSISADGLKLDEVFYVGESGLTQVDIASQIAAGAAKIGVEILLVVTDAGAKLGFKGAVKTESVDLDIKVKVAEEDDKTDVVAE